MRMRRLGVAVICALAVVVSLTGCGVAQVGQSIVTEQIITAQLTKLVDQVESVSTGVSAEYTKEITGSYTFVVDVQVTADSLTSATAVAIVAPVLAEFTSSPLADQQLSFTLTADDGGTLAVSAFDLTAAELSGEVDYWFGLSAAVGMPLSMDLGPGYGLDEPYRRAIAAVSLPVPASTVDWDAVRSVPDPSAALRSWSLPGIDAVYSLPPDSVTRLASSLPDQTEAGAQLVTLAWNGVDDTLSVSLFSEAKGNRYFLVHLEPCVAPVPLDPEAAAELAAAGVQLPPGAGSGACPVR